MTKAHENIKTENKKNEPSSTKTKLIWISIILLILIIFSVVGYSIKQKIDEKNKYEYYRTFKFEKISDMFWRTYVLKNNQELEFITYNHPLDLEQIPFNESVRVLTLNRRHMNLTLAISPEADMNGIVAGVNIARITGNYFGLPTNSALYIPVDERNLSQNYTRPPIDCSEATELSPILWLLPEGNETSVYLHPQYPNCIIVSGSNEHPEDIIKSADLYTFKIMRIME